MKLFGFVVAFLLPLIWDSVVVSQDLTLAPGTRVRVAAPDLNISSSIGEVEQVNPDTLVIRTETSRLVISMTSVKRLEISQGFRRNTLKGSIYGALIGCALFGIVEFAVTEEGAFSDASIVVAALMGAAVGAGVGAIAGRARRTESWKKLPLPVSLSVTPLGDGDYAVGLAFRYNIPIGH